MVQYIKNPKTGRDIKVGGPTYEKLLKSKVYRQRVLKAKRFNKSPSRRRGCSNIGKYPNVPKDLFCGPAGGSCPGTYPVDTPRRAIAAMSYARHAPDPEGIKSCARGVARKKGWVNPRTGRIRRR